MARVGKGDEWILVPVHTLPPIARLQPDQLQKFTKDELRSYLVHYGVTPDPRKPEMKAQVRKLIAAGVNGVLTTANGYLICGQKERAKNLAEIVGGNPTTTSAFPSALSEKKAKVKKQVSITCRNCGEITKEGCQYSRCGNCCLLAGLKCAVHSLPSLKRKREVNIGLAELNTLAVNKRSKGTQDDWCSSPLSSNKIRLEEDPLKIASENAKTRHIHRDLLIRQIFSHQRIDEIIEDMNGVSNEYKTEDLEKTIRTLLTEVNKETHNVTEKYTEILEKAKKSWEWLDGIDNVANKEQLKTAYNEFETSTGINTQFYPHLIVQLNEPPSRETLWPGNNDNDDGFNNTRFKLFRDTESPTIQTI
eukprot:TRINITY_DN4818_c0_g1_i1.p1 TRINITY_DN4818_c0_g1~~TRINITY_DN4818_c0_g1_i1.p1  ORF type:complete len:362 (-),score=61.10 TRINITY_DN4818_c0_g1_i1:81-1166(-)